ncbi:MAG: glycosyltransferase [Bacteroidetes bacterium]|nr:glycosyltransferase [Bacteroidota bacterium]
MIDFSFVIPVYNSIDTLEPTYKGINDLMQKTQTSFEVIFVEDNGIKESWRRLLELKKTYPNQVTIIKLTKNFGQNGATLCGISEANGKYIVTLDDDLQVNPSEIEKLIVKQKETNTDVVFGNYKEETQHYLRNLGSQLIKKLFNKLEGGANVGSSVRLISSAMAKNINRHSQDHIFLNQILSWYTYDVQFVEIDRNHRKEGRSGYSLFDLLRISFRLLFLYTSIPLKFMLAICIVSSITSLALAGYYIYQHFALGHGLGFLSLVVIAISLILASNSVMGIYINRLYNSRFQKPHFSIKIKM